MKPFNLPPAKRLRTRSSPAAAVQKIKFGFIPLPRGDHANKGPFASEKAGWFSEVGLGQAQHLEYMPTVDYDRKE
jgi:hypothetical protein